jgi:LCP family protein required for cell wall assembly
MPEEPSVDFLKKKYGLAPDRTQAKRFRWVGRLIFGGLGVGALTALAFSWQVSKTIDNTMPEAGHFSIISTVRRLVGSEDKPLTGEADDQVNFLLLGVGGDGHDGSQLTDTIMFSSFRPSTKEIGLLSIPRDLAVPLSGRGYQKINAINAYAEMDEKGSGPETTAQAIGDLLDQPIHYYFKVDFNGFKDLIDAVGGVDVYVENSFTDNTYPSDEIGNVMTVNFEQGWKTMDGATALIYSRSRHGNNGEGTDFARAARQQKILLAVKDKVLSPSAILNPSTLNKIINTFQANVQTNMSVWEMLKMAKYAPEIQTEQIGVRVLDSGPDSPLYATNINGAFVLLPKRDDWSALERVAAGIFSAEDTNTVAQAPENRLRGEVKIEIQNGTATPGLAFQTSQLLASSGFQVVQIGNAESRDYSSTIIYDLTNGKKASELSVLKEFLEADVAMSPGGWIYADNVVPRELTVTVPGQDQSNAPEDIDFLVILGEDASSLVIR